jgi:enoyl-CoA hydratase
MTAPSSPPIEDTIHPERLTVTRLSAKHAGSAKAEAWKRSKMSQILFDVIDEGVAQITLNRPDRLNAFTYSMYDEFFAAFNKVRYNPEIRVVILTGAGKAFCSGADLQGAGSPAWVPDSMAPVERQRAIMDVIGKMPMAMRSLPQPVICAVNGSAAGIGYSLTLASDLCITVKSAKFVPAFHNAGTGSEMGASWLLPRTIGLQRAMEALLTGRTMLGEETAQIGLTLAALDDIEALNAKALDLANQIKANVPRAVNLVKQSVWGNLAVASFEAAVEMEMRAISLAQNTEDAKEKRTAMFEKRAPKFNNR